ncbi:hypothetical protein LCGC14_2894060 [marine sediment metagenome]|uniref:Uncharacterized protein n=1 Tax=marine sediment metagenome TaxID=412755 RepID=A0A0F8XWF3_9ZZZZ
MSKKIQLAKIIFLEQLATMKAILDLVAFKLDKKSSEFLYMKKQIMNYTYGNLKKTFITLEEYKMLKHCPTKCKLRQGYKDCECGGSGYINV